jgi:signal transduction histidine kinase
MRNLSLSLFSRLYLVIVVAVIISVSLTNFFLENYEEQEDFNEFISEVNYIFKEIAINAERQINTEQQLIPLGFPLDNFLTAKLVNPDMNLDICSSCQLITHINNTYYYQMQGGERLAEFKLPKAKSNIIIYEKNESELNPEDFPEELPETFPENILDGADIDIVFLSLILITSILLGFAIYWPIKNLQNQIKSLIDTHHQFGLGNLTAKADEDIQKPLDELAHSFNNMAQAIANNVKERDTFSQAIPHEVRTPLSRIQLASGLIRRKSTDLDILALVDDVDNYVVDINELIGQIVEYSKVNSNSMSDSHSASNSDKANETDQFQTIEVKAFIESRVKLLAKNQHKELILSIDESLEITTNPFYLRLLIDNFIKNAVNHAQQKIKLSAKIEQDQLSIVIEDDGAGVSIEDRETIFIAFARLDKSRSRKTGGLGLGLPIAKAAATKMAGKIVVSESSLGGALFSFNKSV